MKHALNMLLKASLQKCHFEYGQQTIQTNASGMNFWLRKYLHQNIYQKIHFTNAVETVLRLKTILKQI